MQAPLRGGMEADGGFLTENQGVLANNRRMLAENTRVRQALDNAGTIVVVADEKHEIVYANETAKSTFAPLQPDFQRELPQFSAAPLVGASIDIFRPLAALDRAALARLPSTSVETLAIGGHTMVLR